MNRLIGRVTLGSYLLTLAAPLALADNTSTDLSLSDLLDLKSSVSSKKEQKISDAPGMVTVYSAKDVERLGYYNLTDLANITAGYSSNVQYGNQYLETRGQTVTNSFNNNRHLLLIDGIPVNHTRSNSAIVDSQLPVYFAERVEFLKGPASALYGTGAFLGVVNMVPKKLDQNGVKTESKFSAGNYGDQKRFLNNTVLKTAAGETLVSVGLYNRNSSYSVVDSANPNDAHGRYLLRDRDDSQFIMVRHQVTEGALSGISLGLIYMRRNGGLGEGYQGDQGSNDLNDITWSSAIPYLKYTRPIGDLTFNSYLKANFSQEKAVSTNWQWQAPYNALPVPNNSYQDGILGSYNGKSVGWEALAELQGKVGEATNWTAGVNLDARYEQGPKGNAYSSLVVTNPTPSWDIIQNAGEFANQSPTLRTISFYGQVTHQVKFLHSLDITAGLREDTGGFRDITYGQLSPRIGLVQKFNESLGFKVLYGTALRAPSLKERQLNSLGKSVLENPPYAFSEDVKPETIKTLEVGPVYQTNTTLVQAVAYVSQVKDSLVFAKSLTTTTPWLLGSTVANQSGITKSRGFEIEGRQAFSGTGVQAFGNLAYAVSEDPSGAKRNGIPIGRYNLGASYTWKGPIEFTATALVRGISNYWTLGSPAGRETSGWKVGDVNLMAQLSKDFGVEFMVRNIGDSLIKLPDGNLASFEQPGRNYLFTLSYKM